MPTGSGTGTRAAAPYAVTAGELIAAVRVALDDGAAAAFSDDDLLAFVAEGVREYSQHRPRAGEVALAAVAGSRRYALPWDATAVLSVEYSREGETPSYIYRSTPQSRRFAGGAYYDVRLEGDLTGGPALWLGFEPEAGAALTVRYQHPHAIPATAADYLTLPADHHHVLVQYALFAAARQLQAREQAAPTNNSSLLMAQLASNTRRLELAYLNALNRILSQGLGEGAVRSWVGKGE